MRRVCNVAVATAGAALLHGVAFVTKGQPVSYTALFDGSFEGWTIEDTTAGNFRIVDGALVVEAPEGWLKSAAQYADFELEIEFRFMTDDADSGVFVRAIGERPFRRGWPNESYQVQLRNPLTPSPFPAVGGIFRHGMPPGETVYDEALANRASRPTGEWQMLFIRVVGERLSVALNGIEITTATGIGNVRGHIGLQGETGALEFRSIAIRVL